MDERRIEISSIKLLYTIICGLALVAVCYALWQDPGLKPPYRDAAVVAMACFALCASFGLFKLFDDRPALVFSPAGLVDRSSALAVGFIDWSDVVGWSVVEVNKRKFLQVNVAEPEKYLRELGLFKQMLARISWKTRGSPIHISSSMISMGFDELTTVFEQYHAAYGAPSRRE